MEIIEIIIIKVIVLFFLTAKNLSYLLLIFLNIIQYNHAELKSDFVNFQIILVPRKFSVEFFLKL